MRCTRPGPGRTTLIAPLLIVFAAAATASQSLPIPNAGFERWVDGRPDKWSSDGPKITRVAGADAVEGEAAARVVCEGPWNGLRLDTDLEVRKNTTYAVLLWARVEPGGGAKIQVDGMIEVDKNDFPVGPDMQLMVYHFKTPGTGDPATSARVRILATRPGTTFVLDGMEIREGFMDFATLSPEQRQRLAPRWTFHAPEIYRRLRRECREHLEAARANFNSDDHPRYRTAIEQTDETITLTRQMYSMGFDRRSACVKQVTVRGEQLEGAALPDLTVVTGDGVTYAQSRADDGRLRLTENAFNIILSGEFTPRSADGRDLGATFTVEYDFYKMAGFMTVAYRVKEIAHEDGFGGIQKISRVPPVRRITVSHGIGRTREPMNTYYRHYGHGADGNYHQAKCYTLESEEDAILQPDRHKYCLWTNGAIGFGVYARGSTYKQIDIESTDLMPHHFAYEVADRKRLITVTFVHNRDGAPLDPDFAADLAVCLFPIKAFAPTSIVHGSMPFSHLTERYADPEEARSIVTQKAQHGLNAAGIAGCRRESLFPSDNVKGPGRIAKYRDALMKWNRILHDHDVKSIYSAIGHIQWPNELLEAEGFYTPEEMVEIRALGDGVRGQETPLSREFLLTMLYNALVHMEFDGLYFDLIGHEIVTSTLFQQDVRLLCDTLPGDKFYVYHNHMEVSPPMALADFSVPGEQFMVAKWDDIPQSFMNTAYNPFLTGIHHRLYNDRSYDLRSMKIWNAATASILSPDVNHYNPPEMLGTVGWRMAGRNDPQEMAAFEKFGLYGSIFDIGSSTLHHKYDGDYERFVRGADDRFTANVFARPGECLLTVSGREPGTRVGGLALNRAALEIDGPGFVVYDTVNRRIVDAGEADGWITLPAIEVGGEPHVYVVKTVYDNRPTVLWHGPRVRNWRAVAQDGGGEDRYGKTGTDDPARAFLWAGVKRFDFDFDSLPGRDLTVVHVGALGRPQMLLGSVDHFSLRDYDEESGIVTVESVFPPNGRVSTARIWFTFEWDDVTPEAEW